MKAHEMAVVALISAVVSTLGLQIFGEDSQKMIEELTEAARVQDLKMTYASMISGHDYGEGIDPPALHVPILPENFGSVAVCPGL